MELIDKEGCKYVGVTREEFDKVWNGLPPDFQYIDREKTAAARAGWLTITGTEGEHYLPFQQLNGDSLLPELAMDGILPATADLSAGRSREAMR